MPVQSDQDEFMDILLEDDEDEDAAIQNLMIQNRAILRHRLHDRYRQPCRRLQGSRLRIIRDRAEGHAKLHKHYFADSPQYPLHRFRRRFRMSRPLFFRICDTLETSNRYFEQKEDAVGNLGFSSRHKCTAAIRQLAYGTTPDLFDDYLQMGESTAIECLKHFCHTIVEVFGPEYLRKPTENDLKQLLAVAEERGMPGMLGSLDCMHWEWKNCPTAWHGQYCGKEKAPTLVLEAVASHDLWIWHAYFGLPGTLNDLSVLARSPLFLDHLNGKQPTVKFTVNDTEYSTGYYLSDGIYPEYTTLIQTISSPDTPMKRHFAKVQEALRKDIERAFGVLQGKWHILRNGGRLWSDSDLEAIVLCCIILHNMNIEDNRNTQEPDPYLTQEHHFVVRPPESSTAWTNNRAGYLAKFKNMRDKKAHHQLKADLVQHLWNAKGAAEKKAPQSGAD